MVYRGVGELNMANEQEFIDALIGHISPRTRKSILETVVQEEGQRQYEEWQNGQRKYEELGPQKTVAAKLGITEQSLNNYLHHPQKYKVKDDGVIREALGLLAPDSQAGLITRDLMEALEMLYSAYRESASDTFHLIDNGWLKAAMAFRTGESDKGLEYVTAVTGIFAMHYQQIDPDVYGPEEHARVVGTICDLIEDQLPRRRRNSSAKEE